MGQGSFHRTNELIMRRRRHALEKHVLGGVFQGSRRVSLSIADDYTARRIGCLRGNACRLQRSGVGYAHVAVITANENRCVPRDWIDHFLRRKFSGRPLSLIPVTAENPRSLRRCLAPLSNPTNEFLDARGVVKLHIVELRSAGYEMNV